MAKHGKQWRPPDLHVKHKLQGWVVWGVSIIRMELHMPKELLALCKWCLYVGASSPLEVLQNIPSSHIDAHKPIIRLPSQKGSSLTAFQACKSLPRRSWVKIKKHLLYEGDLGYVETSNEDTAIVIVMPRQWPYNIPKQSGKKMEFSVELARLGSHHLVPILSASGTDIGYSCGEQQYVYGLLRLSLAVDTLELVNLPHLDNLKYHMLTGIDRPFVEQTMWLFSAQFWKEKDKMEIWEGNLKGKEGRLGDVDWYKRTATILCDGDAFDCSLHELHRKFSVGDVVKIMVGPFSGEASHVTAVDEGNIIVVIMQENETSDDVSH